MILGNELISSNTQEILALPFDFIPHFIIAVAIIIIGWIIGWLVEKVTVSIFNLIPFVDEALRGVGFESLTQRAGLRVNVGRFFGVIFKVFIIFVFLVAAIDIVGLQTVNEFIVTEILGYIPNVVSAALILVIGLVVADVSARFVSGVAQAAKINEGLTSKITKWAIIGFSVIIAVSELGIASEVIQAVILGMITASSIALGLAFGLGGQQAASDFIDRIRNN